MTDAPKDAWDRIMADLELTRARQKLSIHEIRLIISHAKADERAMIVKLIDAMISDESGPDYGMASEGERATTRAMNRRLREVADIIERGGKEGE